MFQGSTGISSGFLTFSRSLTWLIGLERLSLNFDYCSGINDEGLYALGRSLNTQMKLKYIAISLKECYSLTDSGLKKMQSDILGNLTQAQLFIHHSHSDEEFF